MVKGRFRVWGLGLRVQRSEFKASVQGLGFMVWGCGMLRMLHHDTGRISGQALEALRKDLNTILPHNVLRSHLESDCMDSSGVGFRILSGWQRAEQLPGQEGRMSIMILFCPKPQTLNPKPYTLNPKPDEMDATLC